MAGFFKGLFGKKGHDKKNLDLATIGQRKTLTLEEQDLWREKAEKLRVPALPPRKYTYPRLRGTPKGREAIRKARAKVARAIQTRYRGNKTRKKMSKKRRDEEEEYDRPPPFTPPPPSYPPLKAAGSAAGVETHTRRSVADLRKLFEKPKIGGKTRKRRRKRRRKTKKRRKRRKRKTRRKRVGGGGEKTKKCKKSTKKCKKSTKKCKTKEAYKKCVKAAKLEQKRVEEKVKSAVDDRLQPQQPSGNESGYPSGR